MSGLPDAGKLREGGGKDFIVFFFIPICKTGQSVPRLVSLEKMEEKNHDILILRMKAINDMTKC